MPARERVEKQKAKVKQRAEDLKSDAQISSDAQALKAELDDVLDEIDGVLEENAEEFVKGYVQKGGE